MEYLWNVFGDNIVTIKKLVISIEETRTSETSSEVIDTRFYSVHEILSIFNSIDKKEPRTIHNIHGGVLPFIDRTNPKAQLHNYVKHRLRHINGQTAEDTVVAQIAGAPGTGKTALNARMKKTIYELCNLEIIDLVETDDASSQAIEEAFKLQEYLEHSLFLTLTYGNGVEMIEAERDVITVEDMIHYFWVRVLLFYFTDPEVPLSKFAQRFSKKRLSSTTVIEALAIYANVKYIEQMGLLIFSTTRLILTYQRRF
jgi:hypothetical protein